MMPEAASSVADSRPEWTRVQILPAATVTYLALLPLGHMGAYLIQGARATWADLLLAALLVAGALELLLAGLSRMGDARDSRPTSGEGGFRPGTFTAAAALLVLFAGWVLLGSLWSHQPGYAAAKGVGLGALALGAVCIRWSGLEWRRAADAWLLGMAVSVILVYGVGLLGPEGLRGRLLYLGGMVHGLPVPRVSGPFGHPNLFGDYLVLSGVLLWARWPAWSVRWRKAALVLAGLLGLSLLLTTSTAWLAAGILALLWGFRWRRKVSGNGEPLLPWFLIVAGGATTIATLSGVLFSMDFRLGPLAVTTGGIRPRIWASALGAFAESPLLGVGASPYVAEAAEPMDPEQVVYLWDAHSVYLSVLGQYGLVGLALLGGGLAILVRGVFGLAAEGGRSLSPRVRTALLAGFLALAIHGTLIAGEDFRHWWAWLGLAGLALARGRRTEASES